MPRKRKTTKLIGSADLRSIHHISVDANRNVYDHLSHYLLAVHHLGTWLEQAWINPAEYRRIEKTLAKRYGFSDKSIFRPNRGRLEK